MALQQHYNNEGIFSRAVIAGLLNILNNPIIDVNDFEIVNIIDNEKQNKVLKGDLLFNNLFPEKNKPWHWSTEKELPTIKKLS